MRQGSPRARLQLASLFLVCSTGHVKRISENHLLKVALEAIEEAAAASHYGSVPRTRGLALALAWLRHRSAPEPLPLWPFKSFWDGLACEREHDRWSAVNAAANAIYLALGERRSPEQISAFEGHVRQRS